MNWNEKRQPGVGGFIFVPQSRSHPQGHGYHSSLYVWQEAPQAPIHQLPWHHLEEKAQRPKERRESHCNSSQQCRFHNLHGTAGTWKVEHFGKMNQLVMFLLWDSLQEGRPGTSWRPSYAMLSIIGKSAVLASFSEVTRSNRQLLQLYYCLWNSHWGTR